MAVQKKNVKRSSLAKRNLQKFFRNRLAIIGSIIVILLFLSILLAPVLTGHDPTLVEMKDRYLPPSNVHLLGTDSVGRDLFARLLYRCV